MIPTSLSVLLDLIELFNKHGLVFDVAIAGSAAIPPRGRHMARRPRLVLLV